MRTITHKTGASARKRRALEFGSTAASVAILLLAAGAAGSALAEDQSGTQAAAAGAEVIATADAPAQADQGTTVEDVVVTGIRASIRNSIALKKNSDLIVEAVSAEDIGKLPDNSIAESIARLPGLTAQRLDGRDQVISIRGLSPDFSTTLLNGREQVSTGDNRGVEYDQYPSEVMSGVVVYKTPMASMTAAGLSGTVDLQTIRPLTYGHNVLAFNARYQKDQLGALNSGSQDTGTRFGVTYVGQFDDGKLGVAIAVGRMQLPTQIQRWNSWGYPSIDGAGDLVLGGAKPFVASDNLTRTGGIGTIEFQPDDHYHSTIDMYYSRFEDRQLLRGIELPLWWGGLPLKPGYTITDGLVTAGEFDGVKGVVRNDENTRDATLFAVGWNNQWRYGDWTTTSDLSYSRVKRQDQILETYAGTGRAGVGATDNMPFTMNGDTGATFGSILNYADPNLIFLTSPQGWGGNSPFGGGQDGYLNSPHITDELADFKLSTKKALHGGPFGDLELGFNYSDRTKTYVADEWFLGLTANEADPLHMTSVHVPSQYLLAPTSLAFIGLGSMISYDPIALLHSGIYDLLRNPNADVATKGWSVNERVATLYGQLDVDTDIGGAHVTGNVGLQAVFTDQSSDGTSATGAPATTVTPIHDGAQYTEFLPSMNLVFHMASDNVVRVGLARELARARMDQMSASINFNYNSALCCLASPDISHSPWSGGGGNPELRPWIADAADVSWEKYFGRDGYVAAAVFYKRLETFIFSTNSPFDFTGFTYNGPTPNIFQGLVNIPENGNGGRIDGVELTASLPGNLLTHWLDGFGVIATGSYTDSSIKPDPSSGAITIPGLSKYVGTLTAYYEKNGFQVRVVDTYRSSFLGEVAGFGDTRTFRTVKAESVIDAQIGYTFQSGALHNLSILLQATNLNNEPFVTYQNGDTRQVIDYQRYGATYLAGISYKF